MTTFRNPLADPLGTRRGPPLVRGPQFENRCSSGTADGYGAEGGVKFMSHWPLSTAVCCLLNYF